MHQKKYVIDMPKGFFWIDEANSYIYHMANSRSYTYPLNYKNVNTNSGIEYFYDNNDAEKSIYFASTDNWSAYHAFVTFKYYKD